ncbi:MAG: alpha/beta fold hydrolase [bacterium]|nr:alpha/beta fold hydrolase [bacterium]
MTRQSTLIGVLCLLALAPAHLHAAADATAFATALMTRDGAAVRAHGTPEMAAALTDAAIGQLVFGVTAQVGADPAVGPAWLQREADGYAHWRVPLRGTKSTLDFEVVVDGQARVAGLWLRPHVPTPEEAAAAPEPGAPRELEIAVGPAGSALPGLLALPEGDGPFPVVVLVHGSGSTDRDENVMGNRPFRDLAHGLAARGVATVRYDKRSFVYPAAQQALGEALTVQQETIDDAVAAVALARTRTELDPKRVYVLGHSLGGTAGPRIAAQGRADGLIVVAGMARTLVELVLEQVRHNANADGTLSLDEAISIERMESQAARTREAPDSTSFLGYPPAYLADLARHDAPAIAAALEIPVFVLQGGRDFQVTLADFALWEAALKDRPQACLKVYPQLDHLLRAGEGVSSGESYAVPGVVEDALIGDVAGFVLKGCGGVRP